MGKFEEMYTSFKEELLLEGYDYSCAMAYLNRNSDVAKQVLEYGKEIPKEELTKEDGLETEPHVTILYGIHITDHKEIFETLDHTEQIKGKLGKISFFENDDYNVLKIDIHSTTLNKLNKRLEDKLEYTNDYPDYHPHMTIAYIVKDADLDKYKKDAKKFEGQEVVFEKIKISTPDNESNKGKFFPLTSE